MSYEDLESAEDVLAAHASGRKVEFSIDGYEWAAMKHSRASSLGRFVIAKLIKIGCRYRAKIESPAPVVGVDLQSCVFNAQPSQQGEEEDLSRFPDEFRGDNAHLVRCIGALLSLDAKNALWPHGIGGHAKGLLSAAMHRLVSHPHPHPNPAEPLGRDAEGVEGLALEGLDYFERAGDAGDRKYVQAIRELLARRLRPQDSIELNIDGLGRCQLQVRDGVAYMPTVTVQDIVSKSGLRTRVDEATQEAIDNILNRLDQWGKAYPLDLFPEPSKEERDWLRTSGRPGLMEKVAASMGRHVHKMIAKDIADLTAALTEADSHG